MEYKCKVLYYMVVDFNNKCSKVLTYLNTEISKNIREAGIETRPVKTNGVWCHILLPLILITYACLYNVSVLYKLTACLSVGMLLYSTLFIIFLSMSSLILHFNVYGGSIASSLASAVLIYSLLDKDLLFCLIISFSTIFTYNLLIRQCIVKFPKTFTVGESMIVIQSVCLFVVMSGIKFFCEYSDEDEAMDLVNTVVYTVLSTVGLIVTALCILNEDQRNLQNLAYIVLSAALFLLLILHLILGTDCIPRILQYVFWDRNKVQIFLLWLSLLVVAVCVLLIRTKLAVKASTVTRKSFHVLASLVFLSGILFDVYLMRMAAGVGLGVLIFVEALRKANIKEISPVLQSAFLVYSDEKDCGAFAMTPLYLYCGLACPLVLVPAHSGDQLELLSGVLAVGVGDTAASWFGSRYGFNKWPDSSRTMEGTLFNILSQIATVYALQLFEVLDAKNALMRTAIAATVTSMVEAKTDQVDNLILPLVNIIAFQVTFCLC